MRMSPHNLSPRADVAAGPASDQLVALAEVGRELTAQGELRTRLERAMQVLDRRLGARCVVLCLSDSEHRTLEIEAASGLPARALRARYGKGVLGRVAETGRPIVVPNVRHEPMATAELPELLPASETGQIAQLTESAIGPYELQDFFLYHFARHGARPGRILDLAQVAFDDRYDLATLKKWLTLFYKRFFGNQFKRSCTADGPKVGMVALSPRGDWRMPSDAQVRSWIDDVAAYQ